MTIKLGINIHPVYPVAPKNPQDEWVDSRQYSAQEKEDLDRFLIESDASANLVMNDIGWARRIADLLPKSKTIFRLHNKDVEGELWTAHTPASYFEGMKGYFDQRLILNLGNEPDGKMPLEDLKRMVDFYCETMHLMSAAYQEATLPAWGSGNPSLEWFTEDKSWDVLSPLFQAFKQYPSNTLNLHSYFNRYGLGVGSGHVGRHEDIANLLIARGAFIPDMHLTEYGGDLVAGVSGPWQEAFGFDDMGEDRYSEILTLGPVKAFHQSYVKGVMVYCWGAYPRWRLYDISKAKRVQAAIIKFNRAAVVPPPPPATPAVRWIPTTARLKHGVDHAPMHAEPNPASADILSDILGGDAIEYDSEGIGGDYWHIRHKGVVGYVSKFHFEPIENELPAEKPDTEPPTETNPPPPADELKEHVLEVRLRTTDATWAQIAVLSEKASPALDSLSALLKLILPHLVIEDMSVQAAKTAEA